MSNDINNHDTLFPYELDKEDVEYIQKAAKIIFHPRNFNAMDGIPEASEIYASEGEKLFRDIVNKGIDDEDMFYLKTCFDTMTSQKRNCLACKILKWNAPSTTSEETTIRPTLSKETITGLTTSKVTLRRPTTTEETMTRPIPPDEITHRSTTLDDIFSGLNTSQYMISSPITSECTISRSTTSEYTTSLPITPAYTLSQPNESEFIISRPSTSKYATNKPTKPENTITRPAKSETITRPTASEEITISRLNTSESTITRPTTSKETISRPTKLDDIISRLNNPEEYFARYNQMFNKEGCWLHRLNWIPHPTTSEDTTNSKSQFKHKIIKNRHSSKRKKGCARTEGYSKNDPSLPLIKNDKSKEINTTGHSSLKERLFARTESFLKNGQLLPVVTKTNNNKKKKSKEISMDQIYRKKYKGKKLTVSKDTWNEQRRQATICQVGGGNLFSFNHLKFLNSKLKLGKSEIHGLGVFASELIGHHEIIIEYVGEVIRPIIADLREKVYKQSFCFTIDDQTVVDASKFGNISRFINHSCQPNSYAKLLVFNNQKKIVIYAKRDISAGEEITYDYKMKTEDDKIECLCKTRGCKKSLN